MARDRESGVEIRHVVNVIEQTGEHALEQDDPGHTFGEVGLGDDVAPFAAKPTNQGMEPDLNRLGNDVSHGQAFRVDRCRCQ